MSHSVKVRVIVIAIVIVSHRVIVRVIFYFTRLDFNKDYATRALEHNLVYNDNATQCNVIVTFCYILNFSIIICCIVTYVIRQKDS